MKRAIYVLAMLAAGLVSACSKGGDTPPKSPFSYGSITHDGVTKKVLDMEFCYEPDYGYQILLSPFKVPGKDIRDIPEWLIINIPEDLLGGTLNLENDNIGLFSELEIAYRKGFFYLDLFYNDPTSGTVKVAVNHTTNAFEVEVSNMRLHDGTLLSCSAAGVLETENETWMEPADIYMRGGSIDIPDFPLLSSIPAYMYLPRGYFYSDNNLYLTEGSYIITEDSESAHFEMSLYFWHRSPFLSSGTYSVNIEGLPIAWGFHGSLYYSDFVDETNNIGGSFIGGTITVDTTDTYLSLTLKDITLLGNSPMAVVSIPNGTVVFGSKAK